MSQSHLQGCIFCCGRSLPFVVGFLVNTDHLICCYFLEGPFQLDSEILQLVSIRGPCYTLDSVSETMKQQIDLENIVDQIKIEKLLCNGLPIKQAVPMRLNVQLRRKNPSRPLGFNGCETGFGSQPMIMIICFIFLPLRVSPCHPSCRLSYDYGKGMHMTMVKE